MHFVIILSSGKPPWPRNIHDEHDRRSFSLFGSSCDYTKQLAVRLDLVVTCIRLLLSFPSLSIISLSSGDCTGDDARLTGAGDRLALPVMRSASGGNVVAAFTM